VLNATKQVPLLLMVFSRNTLGGVCVPLRTITLLSIIVTSAPDVRWKQKQTKAAAKITAEMTGLQLQDHADNIEDAQLQQYTFMGYDLQSRQLLPRGYGSKFPAFFTCKAAVDNEVIDLMCPLFNKGVRPEAMSSVLLELHAKGYYCQYEKREHQSLRDHHMHSLLVVVRRYPKY
jgi:hypothetical protein